MKKTILSILFFLCMIAGDRAAFAQESLPIVTMTTQKALGETIHVEAVSFMETTLQVDFGDGFLVEYSGSFFDITGTLVGSQTVTIFGDPNVIHHLQVADNQLSSLMLICHVLEELLCHGNFISTLDLGGSAGISRLDCNSNQLSSLPLEYLSNISELYCSGNQLSSLDLSAASSLNLLDCSYNQMTSLQIPSSPNFIELRCEGNNLTHLDITGNTELTSLSAWSNQLTATGLTGLTTATKLRYIDLSMNPITELPDLTALTSLNTLTINDCSLLTLPALPVSIERIWASMESLEYLPDLSSLVNLKLLSITGSKVREIPDLSASPGMTTLRCWSGELRSLPDMSSHTGMTQLYCRNNKLTFEDLEPNIGVTGFQYDPQDSLTFGEVVDSTFCHGGGMILAAQVNGEHNLYQWFKDGTALGDPSGADFLDLYGIEAADAGTYHCEVTNSLVTGMTMIGAAYNIQVNEATLISASIIHDLCGWGEGSIELEPTGPAPFTYYWSNGASSSVISGLREDEYRVTVRDANACETRDTFLIESRPYLNVQPWVVHASCGGSCDGSVEIDVSGGEAPYTFVWDDGEEGPVRENLCSGGYDVRVTDVNGCYQDSLNYIWQPEALVLEFQVQNTFCSTSANNGSIDVQISGGKTPYSFSWDHGAATRDIQDVEAGTYTLTVTDASGCMLTDSAKVDNTPGLAFETEVSHPSCIGLSDGSIDLTVSGGHPPFLYAWNTGSVEEDVDGLAKGSYVVIVTDQMDCTDSIRIELDEPEALSAEMSIEALSCAEAADASASVEVTGGTMPYTYAWTNGETSSYLENLEAGRYDLTVEDANGCTLLDSARVPELQPLSVSADITNTGCGDEATGSISILVEGGTPPYGYSWSNGSVEKDLVDLPAGSYALTVTDANACTNTWNGELDGEVMACVKGKAQFSGGSIGAEDASATILDASESPYQAVQSVRVQAEGAFQFSGIPTGTYIVFVKLDDHAMQNYQGVMHSYYQETFEWKEATLLDLSCEDTLILELEMFENPASSNGKCKVRGQVRVRANGKKAVLSTLPDIVLFLYEKESGLPIATTGIDSEGWYEFTEVAPGSYTILVDIAGMDQSTSHDISVDDATELIEGKDYELSLGDNPEITAVQDHTQIDSRSGDIDLELYPNPAREQLVLRSPAFADGPVTIGLYSETGNLVRTQECYARSGLPSEIIVHLEGLSSGSYIIRLEAGDILVSRQVLVLD